MREPAKVVQFVWLFRRWLEAITSRRLREEPVLPTLRAVVSGFAIPPAKQVSTT
jgi:hypothetical protein